MNRTWTRHNNAGKQNELEGKVEAKQRERKWKRKKQKVRVSEELIVIELVTDRTDTETEAEGEILIMSKFQEALSCFLWARQKECREKRLWTRADKLLLKHWHCLEKCLLLSPILSLSVSRSCFHSLFTLTPKLLFPTFFPKCSFSPSLVSWKRVYTRGVYTLTS